MGARWDLCPFGPCRVVARASGARSGLSAGRRHGRRPRGVIEWEWVPLLPRHAPGIGHVLSLPRHGDCAVVSPDTTAESLMNASAGGRRSPMAGRARALVPEHAEASPSFSLELWLVRLHGVKCSAVWLPILPVLFDRPDNVCSAAGRALVLIYTINLFGEKNTIP